MYLHLKHTNASELDYSVGPFTTVEQIKYYLDALATTAMYVRPTQHAATTPLPNLDILTPEEALTELGTGE